MKKILILLLGLVLIVTTACKVDFPERYFDQMNNNIVLENINTLLGRGGFVGNTYQFQPKFSDSQLADIYYVEAKIYNSLDEVILSTTYKKAMSVADGAKGISLLEDAAGSAPEETVSLDTGWGEEDFQWIPKEDGKDYIFDNADSYRYVVSIYDSYVEEEGKMILEKAQDRSFVYRFDILPASKLDIMTVLNLQKEQDTGLRDSDGITMTNTGLVIRAIVNLNEEILEGAGISMETIEKETTYFQLVLTKGSDQHTSSNLPSKGNVDAEGTPDATGFEDYLEGIPAEDSKDYRYFTWTVGDELADGNWTAKMVLNYKEGSGSYTKEESDPPYFFAVDTSAPVVKWSYIMKDGEMVSNSENVAAADTDVNLFPDFDWDMGADQYFQLWHTFAFVDGSRVAEKDTSSQLYSGTNFEALTISDENRIVFDPRMMGVQEIEVDAYDLAGNKAIAKEGDTETAIRRRLRVLMPTIKPFENAGFEQMSADKKGLPEEGEAGFGWRRGGGSYYKMQGHKPGGSSNYSWSSPAAAHQEWLDGNDKSLWSNYAYLADKRATPCVGILADGGRTGGSYYIEGYTGEKALYMTGNGNWISNTYVYSRGGFEGRVVYDHTFPLYEGVEYKFSGFVKVGPALQKEYAEQGLDFIIDEIEGETLTEEARGDYGPFVDNTGYSGNASKAMYPEGWNEHSVTFTASKDMDGRFSMFFTQPSPGRNCREGLFWWLDDFTTAVVSAPSVDESSLVPPVPELEPKPETP